MTMTTATAEPFGINCYSGKWLWFVKSSLVDDLFVVVACALATGLLGNAAK
eukprot:CAMPEP_0171967308 /NCGR_PEP_ID=MMETSP0993-20121228/197134_1 /TAXON_ID=483369 /ORGANISM="non described non described, Strain CCMP2098" /LENGTH=50 /DNA_ID=CAMNT_0012616777 /DNA_START=92 /DNA_END=241 /DNA_ORIENTATION=+